MKMRILDKVLETVPVEAAPESWLFDQDSNLQHEGAELSVGLYCIHQANIQRRNGDFLFDAEDASAATGYRTRVVWAALRELQPSLMFCRPQVRDEHGKFSQRIYAIASETPGLSLGDFLSKSGAPEPFRKMLFEAGRGYDEIPKYIMENLLALKGKTLAIAITGIRQAQTAQSAVFDAILKHWKAEAGVHEDGVMEEAWGKEKFKKIIRVKHKKRSHTAHVELFHPTTGVSLKNVKADAEDRRREKETLEQNPTLSAYRVADLEAWFLTEYPKAQRVGEELVITCPKCHRSTLRFDFHKGGAGVYACHVHIRGRGENEVFCDFNSKGKVPFHFVAEVKKISFREVRKQFLAFVKTRKEEAHDSL